VPSAAQPQFFDESAHYKEWADEIRSDNICEKTGWHRVKSPYAKHSGIIYDDVRCAAQFCFHFASHLEHRLFVGDVAAHDKGSCTDFTGYPAQRRFVACDHGHANARSRECIGDRRTYAARSARDDGGLSR
jgi:hypothetical protein